MRGAGMAWILWTATWSLVRELVGRKKRPFRLPVPMLGDDGKPLVSLQAKANQQQRQLKKEFGENCAEFSEAEHLTKVQADKQAAEVRFARSPTHTCALPGMECEWEDALHVLSKPKLGRAFGPDAIPSETIAASGQKCRRALGALCAKVLKEGAPMLWKGGDMAAVPRKPRPLTPSNTRGVLCYSCPGKMYAPMSAGMSQTGAVRGGST